MAQPPGSRPLVKLFVQPLQELEQPVPDPYVSSYWVVSEPAATHVACCYTRGAQLVPLSPSGRPPWRGHGARPLKLTDSLVQHLLRSRWEWYVCLGSACASSEFTKGTAQQPHPSTPTGVTRTQSFARKRQRLQACDSGGCSKSPTRPTQADMLQVQSNQAPAVCLLHTHSIPHHVPCMPNKCPNVTMTPPQLADPGPFSFAGPDPPPAVAEGPR